MNTQQARYDELLSYGPLISQAGTVYVLGYQEARQILGDHKRFVKDALNTVPATQRPPRSSQGGDMLSMIYDNMLGTDAPDHTRLRALVSRSFTARQIQTLAPRIQQIVDGLIDGFEHKQEVELIEAYAFPLPIIVICELLGAPIEDRDKFRVWSHAFLGIASDQLAYIQSLQEFVSYIGQMIAERRKSPKDDLISRLVHAEENGQQLSEQELYSMIALLIVAGHETTVNLIGNGMYALLQDRDQLEKLKANPDLVDRAIEEFLRFDGPVEMATTRYAAEDVQIGDTLIRRGSAVVVILGATGRDVTVFDEPAKLDISRESNHHLGFSYGVHYCVGAPLARLEARIAFTTLLKRIPNIRLAVSPASIYYNESAIVRGVAELPVEWG
ncbi:MAG: cytochrome P450 [Chloroflexota bacterium]